MQRQTLPSRLLLKYVSQHNTGTTHTRKRWSSKIDAPPRLPLPPAQQGWPRFFALFLSCCLPTSLRHSAPAPTGPSCAILRPSPLPSELQPSQRFPSVAASHMSAATAYRPLRLPALYHHHCPPPRLPHCFQPSCPPQGRLRCRSRHHRQQQASGGLEFVRRWSHRHRVRFFSLSYFPFPAACPPSASLQRRAWPLLRRARRGPAFLRIV